MRNTPQLQTERLRLCAPSMDDARDVFEYSSNPNVLRYTGGVTPTSIDDTEGFLREIIDAPAGQHSWTIRLKDNPKVLGIVDLGLGDGVTASVHYALAEEHWNKGIVTEAVKAVVAWAFRRHPELDRIRTDAVVANAASIRVMEKCGFEFQEHVRQDWPKFNEPVEMAVYLLSRDRWERFTSTT